ncbi:MFS transporter [Shigella flexneri]
MPLRTMHVRRTPPRCPAKPGQSGNRRPLPLLASPYPDNHLAGYALFYFTRKSFSAAARKSRQRRASRADIGLLATLFYITYGLSKFLSGIVSDRSNARYFMGVGLIATGVVNFFGFSTSLWAFALLWALERLCGLGRTGLRASVPAWYSRNERSWWAIWNTAHNVGGALIPMVVGAAALHYGWRAGMMMPVVADRVGLSSAGAARPPATSAFRRSATGNTAAGDRQQQEGAGLTRRRWLTDTC